MKSNLTLLACLMTIVMITQQEVRSQEPTLSDDDSPSKSADRVTQTCPQYPLQYVGNGEYLYYSHYYAVDCDSTIQTDYLVGYYTWPEPCDGNCEAAYRNTIFTGHHSEIPKNHEILPGRKGDESGTQDPYNTNEYNNTVPPGPARASARRVGDPSAPVYLRFTPDGGSESYFKCFCIDPATTDPTDDDNFFVALELERDPGRTLQARKTRKLTGEHAYVVSLGFTTDILLLRARD